MSQSSAFLFKDVINLPFILFVLVFYEIEGRYGGILSLEF